MRSHRKGFLMLKCLSPLEMLTSPLFEEIFGAFLFFFFFFSCFSDLSLEDLGVLMIFEEKISSSKTSFELTSIYRRWTHMSDWSYARQHG
jgi:hypothetical protein